MAAWYEPPRKPGVPPRFYLGVAWALILAALLVVGGVVLWKLVHPLPNVLP